MSRWRFCAAILVILVCRAQTQETADPARAQALQTQGDWKGAEAIWRSLAANNPGDYRLWASLGIVLVQEGRLPEAVEAYHKALALRPGDGQTELNLGIAYFKAGRFRQAVEPLAKAEAALGERFQTELLLGRSLAAVGRYRDALSHLERAAGEQPGQPELERILGEAYLHSGEYEKAMGVFKQMLQSAPDAGAVHVLLGEAYDASNREEAAIAEFRQAVQGEYVPDAHFGLGYLLWKAHSYDEAAAEFEKELEHDPKNGQALAYLGDVALRQKDPARARELLRRAMASGDENRLALLDLGIIETEARQYGPAERDLRRAVSLDPNQADGHYRLAKLYQATGRQAEAAREFAAVKKVHASATDDLVNRLGVRSEK